MEEGPFPIKCPRCGAEMSKCPQMKKHNKERKTEAVVYECSDYHRCKTTVIVTTKIVNIREAKRPDTTSALPEWPEIRPKDLNY